MKKMLVFSLSLLMSLSAYSMQVMPPSTEDEASAQEMQESTDLQMLIERQKEQKTLLKLHVAVSIMPDNHMSASLVEHLAEFK